MPELENQSTTPEPETDNQELGTTKSLFGENEDQIGEDPYPEFQPNEHPDEIIEGEEEPAAEEPEVNTPQYYTPEEMRTLSEEEIDTSRIPPEMLPFYKAIQGNYTRKHQALSDAARNFQQSQAAPQKAPATLDEAFQRDPQGTLTEIDNTISELTKEANAKADTDPFGAVKLQNKVLQLQQVKDNYRGKIVQAQQQYHQVEALRSEYLHEVSAIPDFESKHVKLTEFAIKELGYTEQELAALADPVNTGRLAAKFVKSLNAMYDKVHGASDSAQTKQVKTTPQPFLRTSGGGQPQPAAPNMGKLFRQAKESGDWTRYLRAKGY